MKNQKEAKKWFLERCPGSAAGDVLEHGAALLLVCNLDKIMNTIVGMLRFE